MRLRVTYLSTCIVLAGCGSFPMSQDYTATQYVNEAKSDFSKGDNTNAANQIENALFNPTGGAKVKELFVSYPKYKDTYYEYLVNRANDVSDFPTARVFAEKFQSLKSAQVFSESEINNLLAKLNGTVITGNKSGSIPIYLGDNIDSFPELKLPENQRFMAEHTIKALQAPTRLSNAYISALMEYVQSVGKESAEGKWVESLLPTMNIPGIELDVVAKEFPEFASARKEQITTRVFVLVKNGDRILSEDILQSLRDNIHGVYWNSESNSTNATHIIIERVRHDETNIPERSQTITYSQSDVNFIAAALLMPRNASYIYDLVSGGTEIEYGYVVSASIDGKTIHDKLIRGKVGGEYHRCQNIHIKNVFGGETSADFIANEDMQQRCSGSNVISMEELHKQVLSKIVDEVLEIPSVKAANDLFTGRNVIPVK